MSRSCCVSGTAKLRVLRFIAVPCFKRNFFLSCSLESLWFSKFFFLRPFFTICHVDARRHAGDCGLSPQHSWLIDIAEFVFVDNSLSAVPSSALVMTEQGRCERHSMLALLRQSSQIYFSLSSKYIFEEAALTESGCLVLLLSQILSLKQAHLLMGKTIIGYRECNLCKTKHWNQKKKMNVMRCSKLQLTRFFWGGFLARKDTRNRAIFKTGNPRSCGSYQWENWQPRYDTCARAASVDLTFSGRLAL